MAKGKELTRSDKIRNLVKRGYTSNEIARKLAPEDPRKQRTIRQQVRRVIARTEELQQAQLESSNGAVLEAWPEIVDASIKRAKRGRVDAAKFLGELSGIHNPKIKHEHSGDIKLSFAVMPRPVAEDQPTLVSGSEPTISEAEVVEGTAEDL